MAHTLAGSGLAAEGVQVTFSAGRVTVVAEDVPLGVILSEWSRLGQTQFVDVERIASSRVSVQMIDVPEPEALRTLLRAAAGYVAAPRPEGVPGTSSFDRVLVMAPSGRRPPRQPPARASDGLAPVGTPVAAPGFDDVSGEDVAAEPMQESPAFTDTADQLELIEQLRERYRRPPTSTGSFGQPSSFLPASPAAAGETGMQSAERPGVIMAPDDEPPRPGGRRPPVRPQRPD
jgi:hypothetical protein